MRMMDDFGESPSLGASVPGLPHPTPPQSVDSYLHLKCRSLPTCHIQGHILFDLKKRHFMDFVFGFSFPRWSDRSLLNFISWAPGKPWPLSKDRKCVYMTASQGEQGTSRTCLLLLNSAEQSPLPPYVPPQSLWPAEPSSEFAIPLVPIIS